MIHETYQVYNRQQKQWVKMRNGKILANSYFQFEGVPVFGSGKPENEVEGGEDDSSKQIISDDSGNDSDDDEEGDYYGVGLF